MVHSFPTRRSSDRQGEALVGLGGGDHPIPAPLLPLSAGKAGNVRSRQVTPHLEVVPPHFVPAPSGPHQNEEVAEEDDAGPHSHEHLAQVHEDGCQEEGVGRQVLKLEAEVFQQQQQERRNRQSHAGGDVRRE